jgi:hypothetical protein
MNTLLPPLARVVLPNVAVPLKDPNTREEPSGRAEIPEPEDPSPTPPALVAQAQVPSVFIFATKTSW